MELLTQHLGAFGKLPSAGDFLTFGQVSEAARRFHDFLFETVEWAYGNAPNWRQSADSDSTFAFLYRTEPNTPCRDLVVGVTRGSRDAAGRVFPFCVYAVLDATSLGERAHILPLALGGFLERASLVLDALEQEPGRADPTFGLNGPTTGDVQAALNDYAVWINSSSMERAWLTLFGRSEPGESLRTLSMIAEILAPFQGQAEPGTKLGVRLPLGAAGSGAVAFWWDVARRIGRWQQNVPILFWEGGVEQPSVVMYFGETPDSSLGELWSPNPNSQYVSDLTRGIEGLPDIQSPYVQALRPGIEDRTMLVSDFLSVL